MKSRELAVPGTAGLGEDIVRREATDGGREHAPKPSDRLPEDRSGRALAPLGLVAVAVAFNLWVLRAEVLPTLNLNDSAVHLSMVRWAIDRMSAGHLPFDGWYPYLGLGSALFHHYQSLPHILAGTMGLAIGPDRAFFGALYVLVATWPISVYLGARLMGWERWAAAGAAALSPLLASTPKYGYEHHSYVWWGYGLWSQAWAMWLLPLAWGCTWRTVSGHRPARYVLAVLLVGLTAAFHFLTGYLAFLALGVWVLIRPGQFRTRIWRAVVVGVSAVLLIAWVVVPALLDSGWASQSAFRRGTKLFDSVGAPKVFAWLFTGQLFDAGRLPVVTLLMLVGTGVCIARFRRDERARALLGVMALSLVLFSGRRTFGFLIQFLPGSDDLLLHRFIMGVQLAGLFLAGVGAAWIVVNATAMIRDRTPTVEPATRTAVLAILGLCVLAPAWIDRAGTDLEWGGLLREQRATDAAQAAAVRTLIAEARERGPGRIYAGASVNWGRRERLVHVPLFAALLAEDADGIGFVLRTTSLSSDFEAAFDEADPSQYELFGIRYVLLPPAHEPPVAATLVSERAGYTLWELETGGYIDVVDTTGPPVEADRVDIFGRAKWFLTSPLLRDGRYPTVAFAGAPAAEPSLAEGSAPEGPAGEVLDERDALTGGEFSADVSAARPAVVLLRSSFEPRWEATVDGEPVTPEMVAPSFVGVPVPAGTHHVEFHYRSFPRYDLLFAIGVATLLALWLAPWAVARSRARRRPAAAER